MFWNLQQQAEIESNTRDISTNRGDMRWNDRKIDQHEISSRPVDQSNGCDDGSVSGHVGGIAR